MKENFTFQQKTKLLTKLFDAGCNTEKKLQQLDMESILKIPGITIPDMSLIIEFQKQTKANKLFAKGHNELGFQDNRVHYVPLRTAYRRYKPRSKAEIYHRPLYGKCLPRLSAERIYRYCSYLAGFSCGAFETGRAGSKGNRPCYRAVYSRFFEYLCKANQC